MTSKQNTNSQPIELQFHVEPDAWLPVSELLTMFHPANSQARNRAELDAIKRHLSDEGFTAEMIVVNPINRKIVSGHGRTQAAHELGYTGTLPVVYREYTTDAEHRRAMLRWNLARGHQDEAKEAAEFAALLAEFDRADLAADFGLVDGEFEALLKEFAPPTPLEDPGAQVDRAEELRQVWGVELGQMWQLGAHRLICGDCTDAAVVARVMGGEKAELLFTSPPYADMRQYSGNDLSLETLVQMFPVWKKHANFFSVNLGIQYKEDEIYDYWSNWIAAAKDCGLKFLAWNVWDRINATSVSSQMKMFAIQHEWILVFGEKAKEINRTWEKSPESAKREKYYKTNKSGQKVTTRRQPDGSVSDSIIGTIYDNKNMGSVYSGFAEMARNLDHPARFPVELPSAYVGAMTDFADVVCEPFSGSGTTLIACEQLSRKCRAVEISPAYVAVALQRWADMTGQTPELLP